jgi:methyl-accepting chemotaxis protein
MKLSTKLFLIVGITLTLGAGVSGYLLYRISVVTTAYSVMQEAVDAAEIQIHVKTQVQEWKDILLRGNNRDDLDHYTASFSKEADFVDKAGDALRNKTSDPQTRSELDDFLREHRLLNEEYAAGLRSTIAAKGSNPREVDKVLRGKDRASAAILDKLVMRLQKHANEFASAQQEEVAQQRRVLLVTCFLVFGAVSGVTVFFARKISRQIRRTVDMVQDVAEGEGDLTRRLEVTSSDEIGELSVWFNSFVERLHGTIRQVAESTNRLASASEEISAASSQMAQGSERQKEQSAQAATALDEMTTTVRETANSSNHAADAARKAANTARKGGAIVESAVTMMSTIAEFVEGTGAKVQELGQRSDQIGEIIKVIDEIADQTNLLALNAAIEAARAGEQGRGFAVVADEVRKLAERTSKATKEIAGMIKSIQLETRDAVDSMRQGTKLVQDGVSTTTQAGVALSEIIGMAETVGDMVSHIATATTQQSAATDQVGRSIEEIANISSQSAAGVQQTAVGCHQLSELAMDLQTLVGKFRIESSPAASHPAPAPMRLAKAA